MMNTTFKNKRILVTGHTGFKGAWLCEWLLSLGADVYGYALEPNTDPSLFIQLGLEKRMHHQIADVRDVKTLTATVASIKPDFVFHLAAQPLVRLSYEIPVETFDTNVMGTVNLLDAIRNYGKPCVIVCVTTDKCYENKEWIYSYRENDPMGGHDPYSASKGAAELCIAAYRNSFFYKPEHNIWLASARAGNVIGGGDWALDRIVPDCIRSLQKNEAIPVRNKIATRPWQHVLEPIGGYLHLAVMMKMGMAQKDTVLFERLCGAFNFGPNLGSNKTVCDLVQEILKHWDGKWEDKSDPNAVHEAKLLNLSIDKAHHLLNWQPCLDFEKTVAWTVEWYRAFKEKRDVGNVTKEQILSYQRLMK